MAKGALAKEQIGAKILEVFEGAFYYNNGKELRIPWDENGVPVQIKIAMTCAKDNVNIDVDGEEIVKPAAVAKEEAPVSNFPAPRKNVEPTEEEKKNIEDLLAALGLN